MERVGAWKFPDFWIVPYDSLKDIVGKRKIDAILFFAIINKSLNNLSYTSEYLKNIFNDSDLYVITNKMNIDKSTSNLKVVDDIESLGDSDLIEGGANYIICVHISVKVIKK